MCVLGKGIVGIRDINPICPGIQQEQSGHNSQFIHNIILYLGTRTLVGLGYCTGTRPTSIQSRQLQSTMKHFVQTVWSAMKTTHFFNFDTFD